jgi:hypothetical protein
MKGFIVAAAAMFTLAACSDTTAPDAVSDLSPSYGRKAPTPPAGATGSLTNALFNFDAQTLAAAAQGGGGVNGATVGAAILEGLSTASPDDPIPTYNVPSNYFIGRFSNTQTVVALNVPNGGTKYALAFDFYAIGSWDGIGKQAQQGAFGGNVFQIGARCTGVAAGTVRDIFTSTFSNQMTVQQNYPLPLSSGGGAKALTGSVNSNNLFNGDPTVNVPLFRSVSDATYHMVFSGANPCGSGEVTFIFRTFAADQQAAPDETWGVDNISIKTDS